MRYCWISTFSGDGGPFIARLRQRFRHNVQVFHKDVVLSIEQRRHLPKETIMKTKKVAYGTPLFLALSLMFTVSVFSQTGPPNIIEGVHPAAAVAGASPVSVTITLLDLGTPPVPPNEVTPTSVKIGSIEGSNIVRNGLELQADFTFPASETNGRKSVTLVFPGPADNTITFFASSLFEISGGSSDSSDDPVNIKVQAGDYPIIDTGQDVCYNTTSAISAPSPGQAFYGQDAQFTSIQAAYRDNGDGTVTDLNTGLMWQQHLPEGKYPQSECAVYADTSTLAGYDDWRLPTIKELYSLVQFSGVTGMTEAETVPYIDDTYFDFRFGGTVNASERMIDAQYATSTIYTSTTMNGNETMFGFNFVDGRIKGYPTAKDFEIRMVRGDQTYGVNAFQDNNDGTITDTATGLMWDKTGSSSGMNWEAALAWVEQLNGDYYLGYDDWRLPDAKELQSIVDYSRSPDATNSPAISDLFTVPSITNEKGQKDYPYYWTSTTHVEGMGPQKAVYISFGRAMGCMNGNWLDVHGAGAQRSDPKEGDPAAYPTGHGPQGDAIRIYNYVRPVRSAGAGNDSSDTVDQDKVTLFAPLGSTSTYLITNDGTVVNEWESSYRPGNSVYLLNDKSLLRTGSVSPQVNPVFSGTGGSGGVIEHLDWDGSKLWEFRYSSEDYLQHHDIEYLPNGNILLIAWDRKTESEAIAAGRNPSLLSDGELWPDKIIEIHPYGSSGASIVWEWRVWDHLIQDYDMSRENYGVVSDHPEKIDLNFVQGRESADWNHVNAVDYNAELDQILITVHNFSEIWIINHNVTTAEAAGSAGDLLYRWGNPQAYGRGDAADQQLFVPHDGEWIPSGCPGESDILVFNNGQNRPDGNYSSVEQISPPLSGYTYTITANDSYGPSTPNWTYSATPQTDFYAMNISGAQRLPDGNTLICDGPAGTFFEVTPAGEKVWEYVNPYISSGPQGDSNSVFRATRYDLSSLGSDTAATEVIIDDAVEPDTYILSQNYPNPFNPETTITFSLQYQAEVHLSVFNLQGQCVKVLVDGITQAGTHSAVWDGRNESGQIVASGMYFYRISAGNKQEVKRMTFLK